MSNSWWPDPEERAARRAALHQKLDDFLDTFIDDQGKGGYAKVESQHTNDLLEIVVEICDLKFRRDESGEMVITPYFENKRRGRFVHAVFPHQPGMHRDEEAWLRWEMDTLSACHLLTSYANTATKHVEGRVRDRYVQFVRDREINERIDAMKAEITKGDLVEAENIADRITTGTNGYQKYAKHTRSIFDEKRPLPPMIEDRHDPRVQIVRSLLAAAMPEAVTEMRAEVEASLAQLRDAPPQNRIEGDVHAVLARAYTRFGDDAFRAEIDEFNAIGERNRLARKAARVKTG